MTIAIMYVYPLDARKEFEPNAKAWVNSYLEFQPVEPHQVIVCMSNGRVTGCDKALFVGTDAIFTKYRKGGWDIGAYQHVAKTFPNYDLMVFCNSRVRFWKAGWLTKFIEAYREHGSNGLYGASGSYEHVPPYSMNWPNAHIRTSCFATSPKVFRRFPYTVTSRDEGFKFESGEWSMTEWYEDHGYPVRMVAWDGTYDRSNWREPANIFRRGDQTNCLVFDRHHDLYFKATPQQKALTESAAGLKGRVNQQARPVTVRGEVAA